MKFMGILAIFLIDVGIIGEALVRKRKSSHKLKRILKKGVVKKIRIFERFNLYSSKYC